MLVDGVATTPGAVRSRRWRAAHPEKARQDARERQRERARAEGRRPRHGHRPREGASPTYASWQAMWVRCTHSDVHNWANYGGKGITVCDRWRDFRNFLADMGERPDGMTIDRIDSAGNYEPSNCRWADAQTQAANRGGMFRRAES